MAGIRTRSGMIVMLVLALGGTTPVASAESLLVRRPFGSHMVIPADRAVEVRGSARPGGWLSVCFAGFQQAVKVSPDGSWIVELPPRPASSKPRILVVETDEERLELEGVLVGEVWLCAGQSNMDFPLSRAVRGREECLAAERLPGIRLLNLSGVHTQAREYTGEERGRLQPRQFFEGGWAVASAESAGRFSAVGWWAGKEIHGSKGIPVGLIDVSVGGSGTEAWLPREVLEAREEYAGLLGERWLDSEGMSAWARGRARLNLGGSGGSHPFQPGFLFDAGVREWRGFPLTGVLWYQGETNAEIHDDAWNERLITDLVLGWRKVLEQPDLPFLMVQLPRIGGDDPLRRWWPQYREVQTRAARKLEGVELIVTKDLGWDSPDVHPPDKHPVGERLGRAAVRSVP